MSSIKYKLKDIEETFKQRNLWDLFLNLRVSKYITYYIVNHININITPNQITSLSLLFAIFSGIAFWFHFFLLGALLYQFSYILDIVDGSIARVKKLSSKIGAFYDVFTDWFKAPLLFILLFYRVEEKDYLILLLFLLFLNTLINKYNDMLFFTGAKSVVESDTSPNIDKRHFIFKYIDKMRQLHIQPFPSTVEIEALLLFFYPIFMLDIFLYLALSILIFNFLLKLIAVLKKLK